MKTSLISLEINEYGHMETNVCVCVCMCVFVGGQGAGGRGSGVPLK